MKHPKGYKLVFIAGARPNFMKVAALIEACKKIPDVTYTLVHTGQHYDAEMSKVFFDELGLPKPDYNLGVGGKDAETQRIETVEKLTPILAELKPNVVVVVGDVTSTLAGAMAAKKLGIPVAHVEAGLRSFNDAMPEEYNRRETDKISDYLFVTERSAKKNLQNERVKGKIYLVGNVMIDTLTRFLPNVERLAGRLASLHFSNIQYKPHSYALLTLHRAENVDSDLGLKIQVLRSIAKKIPVLFPVHPRTRERIASLWGEDIFMDLSNANVGCVPPLNYFAFLTFMKNAKLVLTDSGGIQEETTFMGVPCLTLRNETERPVTVTRGTNQVVGWDEKKIQKSIGKIMRGKWKLSKKIKNWDGGAAKRVLNILAP